MRRMRIYNQVILVIVMAVLVFLATCLTLLVFPITTGGTLLCHRL